MILASTGCRPGFHRRPTPMVEHPAGAGAGAGKRSARKQGFAWDRPGGRSHALAVWARADIPLVRERDSHPRPGRPDPFVPRGAMPFPENLGESLRGRLDDRGATAVYALSGELDYVAAEAFANRILELLEERGDADFVIDMAEVSFIDSTGLRALLDVGGSRSGRSRRITLANVQSPVQRLLALTDLTGQFDIAGS